MKVFTYARLSKKDDNSVSLESQKQAVEDFCKKRNIVCIQHFSEIISGGIDPFKRPEFIKLYEKLKKKEAEGVVILNFTRLSRDVSHMCKLVKDYFQDKHGHVKYKIFFVDYDVDINTPDGFLQLTMFTGFAEWERKQIGVRTKRALTYKREQHFVYCGKPPFGYKVNEETKNEVNKKWIEDENEYKILERIKSLRESGISYNKIAKILSEEGVPNRGNGKWSAPGIFYILNPKKNKLAK